MTLNRKLETSKQTSNNLTQRRTLSKDSVMRAPKDVFPPYAEPPHVELT